MKLVEIGEKGTGSYDKYVKLETKEEVECIEFIKEGILEQCKALSGENDSLVLKEIEGALEDCFNLKGGGMIYCSKVL